MKNLFFSGILALLFLPQLASATVYYIDFSANTGGANNGLASTTPFQSLNQFADNARSAGDIAIVRRGQASTTNVAAVSFTSDGTLNNPITITADYDNVWGDFATSSVTFSPVFGSEFMATSASTTDAFPNKWIYIQGDCAERYNPSTMNQCAYAYEIKNASSTGIQLWLPYKGAQSGSGKNVRVLPNAPQVGVAATAVQIFTQSADDYWFFKGLDLRSTNACIIASSGGRGEIFYDMIFQGNGANDCAFSNTDVGVFVKKTRLFNMTNGYQGFGLTAEDLVFDCNNVAISVMMNIVSNAGSFYLKDGSFVTCASDFNITLNSAAIDVRLINVKRKGIPGSAVAGGPRFRGYFEDDYSVPGNSGQTTNQISANTAAVASTTVSTSTLRVGGGPTASEFFPPTGTGNTGVSTNFFPYSYLKLFEYSIYADTSSKTYSMYFRDSTTTAAFLANPTADQFWIECEAYAGAAGTGANRKLVRSTSVVDFVGSLTWQALSVTCQPTQSGNIYLRGWYGKPRETPQNGFMMDNTPVII